MERTKKNIILVTIILSVFIIPLFFDNRLIDVNNIHRLLFSSIIFILCTFLYSYRIQHNASSSFKIIFFSGGFFLLFILVSSEINDRIILAFEEFSLFFNVFIFAYLIFLSFQLYESENLLFYISLTISVVCLIVALFGIFEFFNINLLHFNPNSRPGSTLSIRNFASEYTILALPFLLILNIKKQNKLIKIFSSLSALIILVFIFFCRTRSSFVVLFFYFVILTIFFFRRKLYIEKGMIINYSIIVLLIIISYFIGIYSAPKIDRERISLNNTVVSIFDENLPENVGRAVYWKTAVKIFRDEPIIGIGTGSWFLAYPNYHQYLYNDENVLKTSEINPHNDFLEVLSENGIFGFIFFALLLITIGINLFIGIREKATLLPVFLSYCGFLIISSVSFPKDNVSIMILFSAIMGISLSINIHKNSTEEIITNKNILKIISLTIVALFCVVNILYNYIRYDSEIAYHEAINEKAVGNYKSMLEKYDKINNFIYPIDANKMPVEFYKGVGYFELKNYTEALNSFNKALELAPYSPIIKSNIAATFYMLKDYENATKLLTNMRLSYPVFLEPQINLLAIYANTGQDSLALSLLNEINKFSGDGKFIKNYFVLEKIKVYYDEKNTR
jgi:putative inorganic carbon (hco3(-)) transporter